MKEGSIIKSTNSVPTDKELELINKYTRREFSLEEVYVFSVVLCDNDIDRDFERFTVEALFELGELFVGKTGICDHNPKAQNQKARIFSCQVEAVEGKKTQTGDEYFRLVARAYMPRTKASEETIAQIESGILKEVSVGCAVKKAVCSVCSQDRNTNPCGHKKGESYGNVSCYYELSEAQDAYEWSFVAVPAQREAGVIKGFQANRKEKISMNEIIKSLNVGDAVTLSVEDAKKLSEYIGELEHKAHLGEQYKDELSQEVLRLSSITEPLISRKTMETVLAKLSISELKEFLSAYREKAEKSLMPKPQLSVAKSSQKTVGNTEFKI
ncbi:MAG: hypothetical protein ACI4GZ_03105 [Ruminococcus sp.]